MRHKRIPTEARPATVTIHDVAKKAGVSTATVSHVFSGNRPVSATRAERVLEASEELGYQISSVARGLATGRSNIFAVHVPFAAGDIIANPFLAAMLTIISTTASAHGYGFILTPAEDEQAAKQASSLVAARRIDGALLLDPLASEALVAALDRAKLPLVSIGRASGAPDAPSVDSDVRAQVNDALGHLLDRGYRRPALLTVDEEPSYFADVESLYREWCRTRSVEARVIAAELLTEDAAFRAIRQDLPASYDSVLSASDVLASSTLTALGTAPQPRGGPIGVVGIGDSYYAQHSIPPLTTIATGAIEKGQIATEMLLKMIDGHQPEAPHVIVPHRLVVRESTPQRTRAPLATNQT